MKLLLVDDQLLFLESLKIVIENMAPDMEVIGIAENGSVALDIIKENRPDVVLMDVRMPVMDGVAAAKKIKELYPVINILMLTTFNDDDYVKDALKNGAAGYMLKNIAPDMLISSIRAVSTGAILISPSIAGSLIDNKNDVDTNDKRQLNKVPLWFENLNPREKSIIKLLIEGKSNTEIASEIFIGPQTIRNYISSIYSKLNVSNRSEAIRKAKGIEVFL